MPETCSSELHHSINKLTINPLIPTSLPQKSTLSARYRISIEENIRTLGRVRSAAELSCPAIPTRAPTQIHTTPYCLRLRFVARQIFPMSVFSLALPSQ